MSALSGCSTSDRLASGSYDGAVRVWDRAGTNLATFAAHPGGVTAASWLPTAQGSLLLTAGKDAAVRLWQVPLAGGGGRAKGQAAEAPTLVSACSGHTDTVAALAVATRGDIAASGGWDCRLLLWKTGAGRDFLGGVQGAPWGSLV